MRVTGGRYRGRTVKCPKGVIRPAMDRMRESLFNILGNISGESFLDLFSGSGVVGIEAASRGAEPVVLVEKTGENARCSLRISPWWKRHQGPHHGGRTFPEDG